MCCTATTWSTFRTTTTGFARWGREACAREYRRKHTQLATSRSGSTGRASASSGSRSWTTTRAERFLDIADEATEDIFHGNRSKAARRCLPPGLWPAARRKLDRLNRARELRELADPPGNRLEALKGDYAGYFSIRINDQYRIVFRFERSDARDVQIVDYH